MSTSDSAAMVAPPQDKPRSRIVRWAWALLVLLLIQNVLGIYLNLFVTLPPSHDLAALIASYAVLAIHVIVGFLILGAAAVVLFLAARSRRTTLWVSALVSLVFAFLAFSSGVEFTVGGQDNVLSFVMELAFLGVVAFDVLVLYVATRHRALKEATPSVVAPIEE